MTEPVFLFRYDVFYKIPIQGGMTSVTVDAPDEETAKNLAEERFLASELGKVVRWHIFDSIELRQAVHELVLYVKGSVKDIKDVFAKANEYVIKQGLDVEIVEGKTRYLHIKCGDGVYR